MEKRVVYCERRLRSQTSDPHEDVTARVYVPEERDSEWGCRYSVSTPQTEEAETAYGEDGLQALVNAIEGLRRLLARTMPGASWLGEDGTGFPMILPPFIPHREFEGLRKHIEAEIESYVARLLAERGRGGDQG